MTALGKKAKSQTNILLTREIKSQKNYNTQECYTFNIVWNNYTFVLMHTFCKYDFPSVKLYNICILFMLFHVLFYCYFVIFVVPQKIVLFPLYWVVLIFDTFLATELEMNYIEASKYKLQDFSFRLTFNFFREKDVT